VLVNRPGSAEFGTTLAPTLDWTRLGIANRDARIPASRAPNRVRESSPVAHRAQYPKPPRFSGAALGWFGLVGGWSLRHPRQPLHHPGQRSLREGFMVGCQSLKGAPVHPLRLVAQAVQYARLPPKPSPDRVRPPQRSIIRPLPLAHRPAGSSADRRKFRRRIESPRAARNLTPGRQATPAPPNIPLPKVLVSQE